MSFGNVLRRITKNRYINLAVGLIMLGSGLHEAWDTLAWDLTHANLQGHHGVMLFGLLHALKTLPDIFEGTEYVEKSES